MRGIIEELGERHKEDQKIWPLFWPREMDRHDFCLFEEMIEEFEELRNFEQCAQFWTWHGKEGASRKQKICQMALRSKKRGWQGFCIKNKDAPGAKQDLCQFSKKFPRASQLKNQKRVKKSRGFDRKCPLSY